ncbi:DUF4175 domain-containing protein [Luteimonas sp. Y-2-2-4F]|nr:DUF4175 domain-containing protein [Luteimonas sp. Y-2-2-4F]MCD9032350.1 DUF4175 domain-containing protein [Luteimonas sp. Y-2-2-4F]
MSLPALQQALRSVRRRVAFDRMLIGLPLALAAAALAWRLGGAGWAAATALAALALVAAVALRALRHYDTAWLAAHLDAARPDMDDSSALLYAREDALGPLQRLQRERLQARLRQRPPPDLRPARSRRRLALAWGAGLLLAVTALAWPPATRVPAASAASNDAGAAAEAPQLRSAILHVQPPAYTGLDAQSLRALDAKAPEGSQLTWRLRIAPAPAGAALEFLDGTRLPLAREGKDWTARHRLQASQLYRLRIDGDRAPAPLHRLDALPDRPPQVRVLAPETTLQLRAEGQAQWRLAFEAGDDYGVAAEARLRIVRTEGSGENQTFHEHARTLAGRGEARLRRFETVLDIAAFGLQPGEDLVASLEVRDVRSPQPQTGRSPSVILRWPPPAPPDADGLDGLARQVLPAYFRSQRQIIIDAEALLAERPRLEAERFMARSDALGVDQRLLRLRYGQFLGEEAEGAARPPPAAGDDDAPPPPPRPRVSPGGIFADGSDAVETPAEAAHDDDHAGHDHEDRDDAEGADHDHGHDHADPAPADGVFGREEGVVAAFGHLHDLPEAATLLDPQTRETLRLALREMWQSELHLRQGDPAAALPYANRALGFIKQVQEADRIYLPRLGAQLPPIDESRRLSGDRDGLAPRGLPPLGAAAGDAAPQDAWTQLADVQADPANALAAVEAWAARERERLQDPLAVAAAIDAVRQDPACADCREALRGLLWQAMPRPAGGVAPRRPADDAGARYLRALREDVR